MEDLIKYITNNRLTCYFISPHIDDVVLSSGALLTHLSKLTKVVVIDIFTKVHDGPPTFSAKVFLKRSKYTNAVELFEDRKKEERILFNELGVNIIFLDFVDALWRTKGNLNPLKRLLGKFVPELIHVYPTYRFHALKKISSLDDPLILNLTKKLTSIVNQKGLVFCPKGIGGHVDHIIVNKVCSTSFKNVIYWEDFPYSLSRKADIQNGSKFFEFKFGLNEKAELAKRYRTQFNAVFPDGRMPRMVERFYL